MKRTDAQRFANRVSTALVVMTLTVFCWAAAQKTYPLDRELWLIRATGYAAFSALILSLSMTPFRHLASWFLAGRLRPASLIALRRSFGIAAACLALLHAVFTLATYLRDSWVALGEDPFLRSGLVALAILSVLLLTSFPELIAALRVKMWQELHRLAYVAAFFVFQHLMLAPFAPRRLLLYLLGGLVLLAALRFLPVKRPAGSRSVAPEIRGA